MLPLTRLLADRITAQGPITFADFMEAALYHPEHGYYASGRAVLGRGGDYFTNVSVGPLFGCMLMRQFAEMWRRLGSPESFTLVEQGAHHGDFAQDVCAAAERLDPLFAAAWRYIIVEPLDRARAKQQEKLALWGERIQWVTCLEELEPFTGVHFSNELIDALPVHIVRKVDGEWRERRVDWQGERLLWCDAPLTDEPLLWQVAALPPELPELYQTEINLQAAPWVQQVAAKLERGWVLAIDYGYPRQEYYRPERTCGTLSAYAHHQRVEDPLLSPGESDLTAHVDFTSLVEAAEGSGLRLAGLVDQHHFMVGLMPLHFHDTQDITSDYQREMRAFKTLMHPNLMGASFKVLGLGKGLDPGTAPLSGFQFTPSSW